jgi:hypothetical protein
MTVSLLLVVTRTSTLTIFLAVWRAKWWALVTLYFCTWGKLNARWYMLSLKACTVRILRSDSSRKAAQWLATSILESWGVLWLVIHLLSVRAHVSSSVIKAWERLCCIPLHACQHTGALPATTHTSPTPRRRTVKSKYSSFTSSFNKIYLLPREIHLTVTPYERLICLLLLVLFTKICLSLATY